MTFTSLGSLAVIVFAASRAGDIRWSEWLVLPATYLAANLVEYLGHRGPMHHRRRGLTLLYSRHTQQHHHFFTDEAMAYESRDDFRMVLFPPVMLLFFLGLIAAPLGVAAYLVLSPNAGWLFAATATAYYLSYEWLHFCYHLPPTHLLARLPALQLLRRHHTAHHDLALMGRYNFNITVPLCDRLFGTHHGPTRAAS